MGVESYAFLPFNQLRAPIAFGGIYGYTTGVAVAIERGILPDVENAAFGFGFKTLVQDYQLPADLVKAALTGGRLEYLLRKMEGDPMTQVYVGVGADGPVGLGGIRFKNTERTVVFYGLGASPESWGTGFGQDFHEFGLGVITNMENLLGRPGWYQWVTVGRYDVTEEKQPVYRPVMELVEDLFPQAGFRTRFVWKGAEGHYYTFLSGVWEDLLLVYDAFRFSRTQHEQRLARVRQYLTDSFNQAYHLRTLGLLGIGVERQD